MTKTPPTIKQLKDAVTQFGSERNWQKFHSPKNISMALSVEASELVEIFQWMTEEESKKLSNEERDKAGYELADIFMYTLLCSEKLGIDLAEFTEKKLKINRSRFPAK